jgi:protein-L-isoaspartate O-methyltransferase
MTHKLLRSASERLWIFTAVLLLLVCGRVGFAQQVPPFGQGGPGTHLERIVPYVPTPPDVVEKMLEVAKVTSDDVVYDLGSGDGRIVIAAAQKFGARAVGVELDPNLYKQSSDRIKELGLEGRAQILHENLFNVNVRHATVVTLFLLTSVNQKLRPMLEKQLRPGARIVSHDFQIPGWEPEQTIEVVSKSGSTHKIYLYVRSETAVWQP